MLIMLDFPSASTCSIVRSISKDWSYYRALISPPRCAAHREQQPDHPELFQHALISRCAALGRPSSDPLCSMTATNFRLPHNRRVLVGPPFASTSPPGLKGLPRQQTLQTARDVTIIHLKHFFKFFFFFFRVCRKTQSGAAFATTDAREVRGMPCQRYMSKSINHSAPVSWGSGALAELCQVFAKGPE